MKADLHVHTRYSDGSYSVRRVLDMCRRRGIEAVGITDHDTTAGREEILRLGRKYGVRVFPGTEISAFDPGTGRKVHLLAFGLPADAPKTERLLRPLLEARGRNTLRQIEILGRLGYPVSREEAEKEAGEAPVLYKQHVLTVLVRKGIAAELYGGLYRALFKNGGPCVCSMPFVPVFDALAAVKGDGGIAVLAHPGQYDSYPFIEGLVEAGLDGIEVFHENHDGEDLSRLRGIAAVHPELLLTGGSDSHGKYGFSEVGDVLAPEGAAEELGRRIAAHGELTSF